MLEYISDIKLFSEISKTLNFREAGERLGYSPAVTTQRIKRLEAVTGRTLFMRTTRHVSLTEEGQELLLLTEKMLDLSELISTPKEVYKNYVGLEGRVRISAPHSFARVFLIDAIKNISRKQPLLSIDLILEDNLTKLTKEGVDISFRIGGHDEHNMDSIDIFEDNALLLASPNYISEYGEPQSPEELAKHFCLSYSNLKEWNLYKDSRKTVVRLRNHLFCNTGDYLTQLAVSGAGITTKSDWSVKSELNAGALVHILPDYTVGHKRIVRALTPKRDVEAMRIKYVLEEVISAIKQKI